MNTSIGPRKSITRLMEGSCLIEAMESVRELCSVAASIRTQNKIRNRQPLAEMKIIDPDGRWNWLAFAPDMVEIIKDESNVKKIVICSKDMEVAL